MDITRLSIHTAFKGATRFEPNDGDSNKIGGSGTAITLPLSENARVGVAVARREAALLFIQI